MNEKLYECVFKIINKKFKRIVELGHVYLGEDTDLNQAYKLYEIFKEEKDQKYIMIDDYNGKGFCNIDLSIYDNISYEKDMIKFVPSFLSRIKPSKLKWENFKNKKVLFYNGDNEKYALMTDRKGEKSYHCLLLSSIYHTYKLGFYNDINVLGVENLIILDKKYKKIENKVSYFLSELFPEIKLKYFYY